MVGAGPTPAQQLLDADAVLLVAPGAAGWRTVEVIKGTVRELPLARLEAAPEAGMVVVALRDPQARWIALGALPPEQAPWLKRVAAGPSRRELSDAEWRDRVAEFVPSLEHPVPLIADTAYAEVARAPYASIRSAQSHLDAARLQAWLDDPSLARRRPLYALLLGVAGGAPAARRVEQQVATAARERDVTDLSALLMADMELRGTPRVAWIERTYLLNRSRSPAEVQAALLALSEQGGVDARVPRARVVEAYRAFIRSGHALAGYVAPDLGRWKDWSAVPDYAALVKSGARQHPASYFAILMYLDSAPTVEARAAAAALRARAASS